MRVEIDGTEVEVFSGARVQDALLKFSRKVLRSVKEGKKEVTNNWGNNIDLEGHLSDGQLLRVINCKNNKQAP
jgi:hypothetical protein